MLIKLTPEQVQEHWYIIRNSLMTSLPPYTPDVPRVYTSLLEATKEENAHVWVYVDSDKKVIAIAVTEVMVDNHSGKKMLLIYSLTGYENLTGDAYSDGVNTLKNFAKSLGCCSITAYTDYEQLARRAVNLGAKKRYFIEIEV